MVTGTAQQSRCDICGQEGRTQLRPSRCAPVSLRYCHACRNLPREPVGLLAFAVARYGGRSSLLKLRRVVQYDAQRNETISYQSRSEFIPIIEATLRATGMSFDEFDALVEAKAQK